MAKEIALEWWVSAYSPHSLRLSYARWRDLLLKELERYIRMRNTDDDLNLSCSILHFFLNIFLLFLAHLTMGGCR